MQVRATVSLFSFLAVSKSPTAHRAISLCSLIVTKMFSAFRSVSRTPFIHPSINHPWSAETMTVLVVLLCTRTSMNDLVRV